MYIIYIYILYVSLNLRRVCDIVAYARKQVFCIQTENVKL